jgi:hypothetical protein
MQVFVMWLDLVTYLHHHGHQDLPWYRGEVLFWRKWSYSVCDSVDYLPCYSIDYMWHVSALLLH